MSERKKAGHITAFIFLTALAAVFIFPLIIVVLNSFKSKFDILGAPFTIPNSETFVGFENYINSINSSGIIWAFFNSLFITVGSVALIIIACSMTSWFIVRVKSKLTKILYYAFVFSMIVPFQMVMYTMTYTVNMINFNNPVGIIFVYLGFGAGLAVFMFTGFIKSVPLEIEESATIDGCGPLQTFFYIVFPILKPTAITIAILNAMWIWNDYLLPYLILGTTRFKTLPVAIQITMTGAYGAVDWGGFMAMLVLAVIPIIVFYLICQKYIIEGVVAGAVKG